MDRRCIGCPDKSESMFGDIEWSFCLNKEVNERRGNKGTNYPSCMVAQTNYCDKDYRIVKEGEKK